VEKELSTGSLVKFDEKTIQQLRFSHFGDVITLTFNKGPTITWLHATIIF